VRQTRYSGQDAFVDVHIQVDPSLTVEESHRIASEVEEASVTVRVEPQGSSEETP